VLSDLVSGAKRRGAEVVLTGELRDRGSRPSLLSALVAAAPTAEIPEPVSPEAVATVPFKRGTLTAATSASLARRTLAEDWAAAVAAGRAAVIVARHPDDADALAALAGTVDAVVPAGAATARRCEQFVLGCRPPLAGRGRDADSSTHLYVVVGPARVRSGPRVDGVERRTARRWASLVDLDRQLRATELVLSRAPPDPAAERARLGDSLASSRAWVVEASHRADALAATPLGHRWRERAAAAEARLAHLEQARAEAVLADRHRRAWLGDHTAERRRLAELDTQRGLRVAALVGAIERASPSWVGSTLGPRPAEPVDRHRWREALAAVAAYRDRWGIDDRHRAWPKAERSSAERIDRRRVEVEVARASVQLGLGLGPSPGLCR
jgi:hypothetical protein